MKAVVTGGCGFIGSHLVERLLKDDFEVVVLDNHTTGRPENLAGLPATEKLKSFKVDISDPGADLKKHFSGADFIFHLAALADIVPSILNPDTYYKSNVHGTFQVMQAARQIKGLKKLIYAASSSCYGLAEISPTPETSPIKPEYPYALTKRIGEEIVMHWGNLYKIPVNSMRFFNVYGTRSRTSGTYGAVFGVFLAQKIAGKPYTVVGNGNQTRDFTYVTDVAEAVYVSAKSAICGEIMNVGSGHTYSINRLVELLGGPKVHIPKRPGEPDCTFADITKIKKLLNWTPKVSLEDGVAKMLKNLDYWKNAPVWDPDSIARETKAWFEALS